MSIQSEINRIKTNVASAYTAVEEKGGTVPAVKTSANLAAAVQSIPAGSGSGVPTGCILIWSGASNAVPDGWALCDGKNGTPDLRGRFVLGENDSHEIGSIGGSEIVTLTLAQIPSHSHKYYDSVSVSGENAVKDSAGLSFYRAKGQSSTTTSGGGSPHENMPPYYTLCYIMKL